MRALALAFALVLVSACDDRPALTFVELPGFGARDPTTGATTETYELDFVDSAGSGFSLAVSLDLRRLQPRGTPTQWVLAGVSVQSTHEPGFEVATTPMEARYVRGPDGWLHQTLAFRVVIGDAVPQGTDGKDVIAPADVEARVIASDATTVTLTGRGTPPATQGSVISLGCTLTLDNTPFGLLMAAAPLDDHDIDTLVHRFAAPTQLAIRSSLALPLPHPRTSEADTPR